MRKPQALALAWQRAYCSVVTCLTCGGSMWLPKSELAAMSVANCVLQPNSMRPSVQGRDRCLRGHEAFSPKGLFALCA